MIASRIHSSDDGGTDAVFDDAAVDPDDPLTGLTVTVAADPGTRVLTASSRHLSAEFEVRVEANPSCG